MWLTRSDRVTLDGPFAQQFGDPPWCCVPVACKTMPEIGRNGFPCCFAATSDRDGAQKALFLVSLALWLEVVGDVWSMLTLLREGQAFSALFMALGLLASCVVAPDVLQVRALKAAAMSLRRGFHTKAFLFQQRRACLAALTCTSVRLYSLLARRVEALPLAPTLFMAFLASSSICFSIPEGVLAFSEPAEAYGPLETARGSMRSWRSLGEMLCPWVAISLAFAQGVLSEARLLKAPESPQAVLLLALRLAMLLAAMRFSKLLVDKAMGSCKA